MDIPVPRVSPPAASWLRAGAWALVVSLAVLPGLVAAMCTELPSGYVVYAGDKLDIDKDVTVNGTPVTDGKTDEGSFLGPDGVRGTASETLPDLQPPLFPANPSSVDADEDDSPFVSALPSYYDKIKIDDGAVATFSGGGPFHIDKLEMKKNTTLNLAAGVYYIDELKMEDDSRLVVTSADVIVHIGDKFDVKKDVRINDGGGVTDLQVMLHDDAEFKGDEGLRFAGVILGPDAKKVEVKKESFFHGAIISGAEVKLDKDVQMTLTPADQAAIGELDGCDDGPAHFAIQHAGSGLTCAAEPVTIRAHLADETVMPTFVGSIALSTDSGAGDWSLAGGSGVLVNNGGGSATYTFGIADLGVAALSLRHTTAATVDIDVSLVVPAGPGVVTESAAEDAPLVFAETGFRFLAGGAPSAIGTQIAGKTSAQAPGAQSIELQAIRTDTATGACQAALTGMVTVGLAAECREPGLCGAAQAGVNGVAVAGNAAGAVSAYTDLSLDFGDASDGTATLVLSYADAGRLRLHARHVLLDAADTPSGGLMSGASNEYVVRPFGFEIDFSGDRATLGTGGVSYAADADGTPFVAAGVNFDTTLRAVAWQAADDSNADGVPDVGANLSNNATTVRFGAESVPASAVVSHALVAPAGGNTGSLLGGSPVTGFAAGVKTAALRWSEVGIIDLAAVTGDYLGGGAAVSGNVAGVGRFYPARLGVSDDGPAFRDGPDAGWGCGFTYMEQPFTFAADPVFTVTAYNADGGITGNYAGEFFKLPTPLLAGRSYASTATSGAVLDAPALGTVALSGSTDFDGVASLTLTGEQFAYNRAAVPEPPFAAAVTLTLAAADLDDGDACYSSTGARCVLSAGDVPQPYPVAGIGGANLRFGRLLMQNASGSELLPIAMPARTEFFDGNGFTTSVSDTCSVLPVAGLDLVNDIDDPAAGILAIDVGAGSSSATLANTPLIGGDAGLQFSAPLAGNTGYVQARFDLGAGALPWLRFDWDGDGAHDDDPVARATFGVLSGSPYFIHLREPWN